MRWENPAGETIKGSLGDEACGAPHLFHPFPPSSRPGELRQEDTADSLLLLRSPEVSGQRTGPKWLQTSPPAECEPAPSGHLGNVVSKKNCGKLSPEERQSTCHLVCTISSVLEALPDCSEEGSSYCPPVPLLDQPLKSLFSGYSMVLLTITCRLSELTKLFHLDLCSTPNRNIQAREIVEKIRHLPHMQSRMGSMASTTHGPQVILRNPEHKTSSSS